MAKKKDSKYYFGKRTNDWLKMKALLDDDFVICGYFMGEKDVASIILGSYEGERLIYQSHVSMGVSRSDFRLITAVKHSEKDSYYHGFPEIDGAVWIEPKLVCTVQFMERTPYGGLRQPVFKGLRDDKAVMPCQRIKSSGKQKKKLNKSRAR